MIVIDKVEVNTGRQFGIADPEPGYSSLIPVFNVPGTGRTFEARKAVMIKLYREGDGYVAENESLDIIAGGSSQDEALLEAVETLGIQIEHYKSLAENQVVGRAVILRETYRNNFEDKR